jgi:hypothetical protein
MSKKCCGDESNPIGYQHDLTTIHENVQFGAISTCGTDCSNLITNWIYTGFCSMPQLNMMVTKPEAQSSIQGYRTPLQGKNPVECEGRHPSIRLFIHEWEDTRQMPQRSKTEAREISLNPLKTQKA